MDPSMSLVAFSNASGCLQRLSKPVEAFPPPTKVISPLQLTASFSPTVTSPSSTTTTSSPLLYHQRLHDGRRSLDGPSQPPPIRNSVIVWFRNDLRVHDNEALLTANQDSRSVLPVYCFDPRHFGSCSAALDKTAPYRAKFLIECVSNLRNNLRERGTDLIVRVGKPEEILVSLAKAIGAEVLYVHQEVSCDEIECETKVSVALQEEGVETKYFWGSTLLHTDDLPFELEEMPCTFSGFLDGVQRMNVRKTLETPKRLTRLPVQGGVLPGDIPTLQELGMQPVSTVCQQEFRRFGVPTGDKCGEKEQEWILDLFFRLNRGGIGKDDEAHSWAVSSMIGGEVEARWRLKNFFVDHRKQSNNKVGNADRVDSLHGSNFCSQVSPWLAMGCLSPRQIFEDLNNNEQMVLSPSMESHANDSGQKCLISELLWRDFFRFITKKYAICKWYSEVFTATVTTAAAPV